MERKISGLDDWLELNRTNWDARVPVHLQSQYYDIDGLLAGKESLLDFEPAEVGDVRGKTLLHLQCHIGLDALSWARRGAIITGLDFSQPALDAAVSLAQQTAITSARFVVSDVYDAVSALERQTFDVVYTSMGSLQYLPDIGRWAEVVARLVAPGGFAYVVDDHPFLQFVDDDGRGLRGDYFSNEAIVVDGPDYSGSDVSLTQTVSVEWIHSTASVVSALGTAGLRVEFLHEHDWTSYRLFPDLEQCDDGHWRWPEGHPRLPLRYSLRAVKDA